MIGSLEIHTDEYIPVCLKRRTLAFSFKTKYALTYPSKRIAYNKAITEKWTWSCERSEIRMTLKNHISSYAPHESASKEDWTTLIFQHEQWMSLSALLHRVSHFYSFSFTEASKLRSNLHFLNGNLNVKQRTGNPLFQLSK